ncbi:CHAT domain-containing protein [Apiospora hydei]|uniref:CHAT domain-containing protein n=1 Tax=Apiospora hydei TaxID=1337664 RepID=A0ABR1WXN1_9PEZI
MDDLNQPVHMTDRAIGATHGHHPDLSRQLNNLSIGLGNRFLRTGSIGYLNQAIQVAERAVGATSIDHPGLAGRLSSLATGLGNRFLMTGTLDDLNRAIQVAEKAVEATPNDHADLAGRLNTLGNLLGSRFSCLGGTNDLNRAIQVAEQVVETTPDGHSDLFERLSNLGLRLRDRSGRTGSMDDLTKAIQVAEQAVQLTSYGHPELPRGLSHLGIWLRARFERTGSLDDLNRAVRVVEQAVKLTPNNHPDFVRRLNNLGGLLGDRSSGTGNQDDLNRAIRAAEQIVRVAPANHPDLAGWLNNLGNYLGKRSFGTRRIEDLCKAIQVMDQAVSVIPNGHPNRAPLLKNLGFWLGSKFSRTGSMDDLNRAIEVSEQAMQSIPDDHPDLAKGLCSLGNWLGHRFLRTGNIGDLNRAIRIAEKAVERTPDDSPDLAGRLSTFGSLLGTEFSRNGGMENLNRAIQMTEKAVKLTSDDHPELAGRLSNLGPLLGKRFSTMGSMDDLNRAIQVTEKAVKITHNDDIELGGWLSDLGIFLGDRFSRTGDMDDLNRAVQVTEKGIKLTPQDHPELAGRLNNLGDRLGHRFSKEGSMEDLQKSQSCFLEALNATSAPLSERIKSGRTLLLFSEFLHEPRKSLEIAHKTIELVPLLTCRSLLNTDKEALLHQTAGLASDAAAFALQAGEDMFTAIELLETGRGLLLSSAYDLRTDVSSLENVSPRLAADFTVLQNKLDTPVSSTRMLVTDEYAIRLVDEEGRQRRGAAAIIDAVIKEIRCQPGLERFLRCPSENDMCKAAEDGPIVIVNTSIHRCDAIIIEKPGIRALPLPLRRSDIEKWDSESLETLQMLWDRIVQPVLNTLGFTQAPPNGRWPRVWWIPTGPLARFPLHAAGDHLGGRPNTTLDRVISSYSSSIRAIMHCHQHPFREMAIGEKVALVSMEETPQQTQLQNALHETTAVEQICKSMGLSPIRPKRQRKEVLSALSDCSLFHFAGHGGTSASPLQSYLLLEDWVQDPLVVDDVLGINLSFRPPFLAYLSACGTGQVRNERLIDEGLHLTAAYQLAGFRHVIGTLWNVDDKLCVDMASIFYMAFQDKGMNDQAVSKGLHFAIRELRERWRYQMGKHGNVKNTGIRDERDAVIRDEKVGEMPALWAPYVHFGV